MAAAVDEAQSQQQFQELKAICVPLMGNTLLTASNITAVASSLSAILGTLRGYRDARRPLKPSIVSYVFVPISTILQRNLAPEIPDLVLEKIFLVLSILCDYWWWECDLRIWEQILMLSGAILGGVEGKGKGKLRDDETKDAAARCLWALLHPRSPEDDLVILQPGEHRSHTRLAEFQSHAATLQLIPVLGQIVNTMLATASSRHMPLQTISLDILLVVIQFYLPSSLVPSVLPGTVSSMTKIALGIPASKRWQNGDTVAAALRVVQVTVVRSVGDDVCVREGAARRIDSLEDFADFGDRENGQDSSTKPPPPFGIPRTRTWLRGTASQLHIALNSLTALISHPTPSALRALCALANELIPATSVTLPQSQPLLLSWLLSLSTSLFESVSEGALASLRTLLSPSSSLRHSLIQTLVHTTKDNLTSLPRLITSQSDSKVEHVADLIDAVCRLAIGSRTGMPAGSPGLSPIATGLGTLLGPTGGVEKWGWSLLAVLEFLPPPVTITKTSGAQLMLEANSGDAQSCAFPALTLKNVSSGSSHAALVRMFRSLGNASGDQCVFAIEWFVSVGRQRTGNSGIAALWCAARLLEGLGGVCLDGDGNVRALARSKRLDKAVRGIVKSIAEAWDDEEQQDPVTAEDPSTDENHLVEHVQFLQIRTKIESKPSSPLRSKPVSQPLVQKALFLQLLSISVGVLQARFGSLLLYTIYPVLHSIVSTASFLSSTGLASLSFIASSMSFASPANLLLSNFDYALDAVSRRLTRRFLDVDATRALVVLVHLVGRDVVQKAGDVVEECFDRLDEFHGYEVVVEGLVEVLGEVVKVVDSEGSEQTRHSDLSSDDIARDDRRLDAFCEWYPLRNETSQEEEDVNYGPAPRRPWGQSELDATDEAGDDAAKAPPEADADEAATPTPIQALTKQIVSRSLYLLTHGSPLIRARILILLSSSVPVLSESALLPSIHQAWPFILNRLSDPEPFVVSAAASLIEALAKHVGSFMFRRVWDDVWPRFRDMLGRLSAADVQSALARRGNSGNSVGTESAYTQSHRLYRSLLTTMATAVKGVQPQDSSVWDVILAFRRFLHSQAHEDLQACARDLYVALGKTNEDAVWLVLESTSGRATESMAFMTEEKWDIEKNVAAVYARLER